MIRIEQDGGRYRVMEEGGEFGRACLEEFETVEELLEAATDQVRAAGELATAVDAFLGIRRCRVCGCTDDNCRECVERTGVPCSWVASAETDAGPICSACVPAPLPDYGLAERGVG